MTHPRRVPPSPFPAKYERPYRFAGTNQNERAGVTVGLAAVDVAVAAVAVSVPLFAGSSPVMVALVAAVALWLVGLSAPAFVHAGYRWWFDRRADLREWAGLNVHWQDWRLLPTTGLTPMQYQTFAMLMPGAGAARPRVKVIEAAVSDGLDPTEVSDLEVWLWVQGLIPMLRLHRYGLSVQEVHRLCAQCGMGPQELIEHIDEVTTMFTGPRGLPATDLLRFEAGGAFAGAGTPQAHETRERFLVIGDMCRRYGWRASWFYLLDWKDEDCQAAADSDLSLDQMRLMVALTDPT